MFQMPTLFGLLAELIIVFVAGFAWVIGTSFGAVVWNGLARRTAKTA